MDILNEISTDRHFEWGDSRSLDSKDLETLRSTITIICFQPSELSDTKVNLAKILIYYYYYYVLLNVKYIEIAIFFFQNFSDDHEKS